MNITDNRNKKEANIGDIIVTNKGAKYILFIYKDNKIALCDIYKDNIRMVTDKRIVTIGDLLTFETNTGAYEETIVEIISKEKIRLVIDK